MALSSIRSSIYPFVNRIKKNATELHKLHGACLCVGLSLRVTSGFLPKQLIRKYLLYTKPLNQTTSKDNTQLQLPREKHTSPRCSWGSVGHPAARRKVTLPCKTPHSELSYKLSVKALGLLHTISAALHGASGCYNRAEEGRGETLATWA